MSRYNLMNFSSALSLIKAGFRLSREGWNGAGQWVELYNPNESSCMTLPYIFINTVQGGRVPWFPSITDLLAEDWFTTS